MASTAVEKATGQIGEATGQLTRTLADAGMKVSRGLHRAVMGGGEVTRRVADALHGTWLGHPLHPVLTDVTIGAWLMGGVFDAIGAIQDSPTARRTGDHLAMIGTASAIPTAVSGMADFSTLPKPASKTGTTHALLNGVNFGLYLLSLRDRANGRRRRGLFFSTVALGLTAVSAWLGGRLVYEQKVGVNHGEEFDGPKEWTPVADAAELPRGRPKRVEVDGKGVLLYRDGEEVWAIGSVCSHAGGPLEEGEVKDHCVQCPWHDSVFDLRDGRVVHGPATTPEASFEARLRDGKVEIRLAREPARG